MITRFNLADFADGVSDVAALRMLLDAGASVRGIRDLHAKLYLFGTSQAIITSANLTEAALTRNQEFGVVAMTQPVIAACRHYFDELWSRASSAELSRDQLDSWAKTVTVTVSLVGGPLARGSSVISARMPDLRSHHPFPFPLSWRMQTRPSSSFSAKAIIGCRLLSPRSRRSNGRAVIGPSPIPRTDAPEASKTARSSLSRGSRTSQTFEFSVEPSE